jgi:ribonuclease P/MRP protein subunit RPP1
VNLVAVWGLNQERGKEAVCEESRKVVQLARMKRHSFRGVVDVTYGGEPRVDKPSEHWEALKAKGTKRKASDALPIIEPVVDPYRIREPVQSKTQMKKRARLAKQEASKAEEVSRSNTGGESKKKQKV